MLQVTTVAQAVQAAERGVDVIIAQGGEAGGYGGSVSDDGARAAGRRCGLADPGGRGRRHLRRARHSGGADAGCGRRQPRHPLPRLQGGADLRGVEAGDPARPVRAGDEGRGPQRYLARARHGRLRHGAALVADAVPGGMERQARGGARERDRLRKHLVSTHQAGRQHDTLLTAGQTAGGIKEILPVADIMRQLMAEAEAALARAPRPEAANGNRAAGNIARGVLRALLCGALARSLPRGGRRGALHQRAPARPIPRAASPTARST